MIGHALAVGRPLSIVRASWDRWIGVGFAIGSACFFVGPFPGFVELVGEGADGVVFFAGSVFFTAAAGLEIREATLRRGRRWGRDPSWWSAAVQFAGTLWFNVSTFAAMQDGLSTEQVNRLVWSPDAIGSACFLVSGVLGYGVAAQWHALPGERDRDWRMAAINLLGCALFGISAIASFIVPSTGSILDLAAANWGTGLGALCFFLCAAMLLRTPRSERSGSSPSSRPTA